MATSKGPEPSHDVTSPEPVRRRSQTGLYVGAFTLVAIVVVLIVLAVANTPTAVELDWVFGSGRVSIVWVIVFSAILGWLVGLVTGALIRRRGRDRT